MRKTMMPGWAGAAALALCLTVLGAKSGSALDYNDVRNLLMNRVPESAIVSMVRGEATLTLTPDQANELRSLGASETLIAAIPAALPPAPAAGATTYGYDDNGNIVYFDAETGQVLSTSPSPAPVVVQPPVVIYREPAPVYVTPPPVVYRRGPSWSFSFGFGGGDRYHKRYYRPPYRYNKYDRYDRRRRR